MITVRVRTIGLLRSLIRQGEFDVELSGDASVEDLLARLSATYGGAVATHLTAPVERAGGEHVGPSQGEELGGRRGAAALCHPPLRVMVNGRDIGALDDRRTLLADGDDVLVLTPIAGG